MMHKSQVKWPYGVTVSVCVERWQLLRVLCGCCVGVAGTMNSASGGVVKLLQPAVGLIVMVMVALVLGKGEMGLGEAEM
jgi:hypothetical protein